MSPEPTTQGAQSPSHLHYHSKAQHRRFSMEVSGGTVVVSATLTQQIMGELAGKLLSLWLDHAVITCFSFTVIYITAEAKLKSNCDIDVNKNTRVLCNTFHCFFLPTSAKSESRRWVTTEVFSSLESRMIYWKCESSQFHLSKKKSPLWSECDSVFLIIHTTPIRQSSGALLDLFLSRQK